MAARNTIQQRITLSGADEVKRKLKDIGDSGQKAFEQLGRAQTAVVEPARQLSGQLRVVRTEITRIGDQADRSGNSLSNFKNKFAVVAGTLTATAVAVFAFTKRIAENYAALDKQAAQLGLTAGQLERYQRAAAIAGVDSQKLAGGLKRISDDIQSAAAAARASTSEFVEVAPGHFKRAASQIEVSALKIGDVFTYMTGQVKRTTVVTAENINNLRAIQSTQDKLASSLGQNADKYREFGISLLEGSRKGRPLVDVLEEIGNQIRATTDKAEQANIADKFGLKEFLPLLNDTEKSFFDFLKIVDQYSNETLTNKLAKDSKKFLQQIEVFKLQLRAGAAGLAGGIARVFDEPMKALLASLEDGSLTASEKVQRGLQILVAGYGGIQQRFKNSLSAAFEKPLTGLLKFLSDNSKDIDKVIDDISQGLADFATDVGRVFKFGSDGKGGFKFIRDEDAKVQHKWLITLREAAVSLGTTIKAAYDNYIGPAFKNLEEKAHQANKVLREIFGRDVAGDLGQIAVIAVLLKITGLLGPIIGLAKLAALALGGVVVPAVGLYALFSGDFKGAIDGITNAITGLFKISKDEAQKYVREIQQLFKQLTGIGDDTKEQANLAPANPYSRKVPGAKDTSKQAKEEVKDANSIAKAWNAVQKELEGFGKSLRAVYDTLAPIGRFLLDTFNGIFGSNFTPAQAGILLIALQLTGVLRTLLQVVATASIALNAFFGILASLANITKTALWPALKYTVVAIAAMGRGLAALALGAGTSALGGFKKLGTFISGTFVRGTLASLARLLVPLLAFAGLPALIIAALAALGYAYWDEIKAGAEGTFKWIQNKWNEVWGDTSGAKEGIKAIKAEHQKYFVKMPEDAKSAWETIMGNVRASMRTLLDDVKKAFSPDEQAQSSWKKWFAEWLANGLVTFDKMGQALKNLFKSDPKLREFDDFGPKFQQQLNKLETDAKATFQRIQAAATIKPPGPAEALAWQLWLTPIVASWATQLASFQQAATAAFTAVEKPKTEYADFKQDVDNNLLQPLVLVGDTAETEFGRLEDAANINVEPANTDNLVAPWERFYNAVVGLMQSLASSVASQMADAVASANAAAAAIEAAAARIIAAAARARAAAASMGGGSSSNSFATGGYVSGPGTGTSDSIPAWLSNGEFVMRAAAVRRYGLDFLRRLNGMHIDPRKMKLGMPAFATGGLVSTANRSASIGNAVPAMVPATMPGKSFDLVIDGQRFGNVLAGEDVAAELMRFAASAKVRSGGRKPGWYK